MNKSKVVERVYNSADISDRIRIVSREEWDRIKKNQSSAAIIPPQKKKEDQ